MEVSDHIKKAALKVRLFGEIREIWIMGRRHIALHALSGESNQYIVSAIRGQWTWSTCQCDGFYYTGKCKHIYVANLYLNKTEKGKEND